MRVPTEAELAAIATAYLLWTRTRLPPNAMVPSRWRVAGRTTAPDAVVDAPAARELVRGPLWRAAGRV